MIESFKKFPTGAVLVPLLLVSCVATCASAMADGTPGAAAAKAPKTEMCEKVVLNGEVSAGHEWKAAFGEGWVFRVVPIPDDKTAPGVGGWDLVVDRDRPAGYPDALLLATPPYHIINPREVATTFGLRAQDAIGWNPRRFRFMDSYQAFRQAHRSFLQLNREGAFDPKRDSPKDGRKEKAIERKKQQFLKLTDESSAGEFRIVGVRLTPGEGQVQAYAINWARQSTSTPHTDDPPAGGKATPLGALEWMRFSVTLWVPVGWKTPRDIQAEQAPCGKRD